MRSCVQNVRHLKALACLLRFSAWRGCATAAVLVTGLLTAGCASQPQIETTSSTRIRPAQDAFVYPGPGGPGVVSVLERHYANATEQQIALATSSHVSGQNMLRVQLFGPTDSMAAGQTRLREGYLPVANINTELRQLFPGVQMSRSPYYVQNRYGPFGYAVGRSGSGDTCLYGWQRLTSTGSTQTLIGNKGSIQIRLRYCDQSLSEARLLQAMYDYTISAHFTSSGWNPYGEPNAPDVSLGKSGAPRYPVGSLEFATVTSPTARTAPARPRTSPRQVSTQAPAAKAEPVGPVVPAPPGSSAPSSVARPSEAGQSAKRSDMPAVTVPPPPCDPATATCG